MFLNTFKCPYLKRLFLPALMASVMHCHAGSAMPSRLPAGGTDVLTNGAEAYIKSVKAYRSGRDLNSPIVELNTDEAIAVEFDDVSGEGTQYDYTLIHCTYDWKPSGIAFMDFCEGFEHNRVESSGSSMGTTLFYTHYSLTLPNRNTRFKISGNYILRVVDSYNHGKTVLQQRFMVVEPMLAVKGIVRRPLALDALETSQQLELEVDLSPLGSVNPTADIVTLLLQNGQSDNRPAPLKPRYISQRGIRYTAPDALIFDGCNEYRSLNLKSFHYQIPQIRRVESYGGEIHVSLAPDADNGNGDYVENPDLNGRFIVKRDDAGNSSTEAEYAWVYFTLKADEQPWSDVYLYGEFTGWELNPGYKLNFNRTSNVYEAGVLLKQGFYNYRYVTVDRQTGRVSHSRLEGNHFAAENSYQVLTYHKPPGTRYWRLVGMKTLNSRYSPRS